MDADPCRVLLHDCLLPEAKLLRLQIEVEIGEESLSLVEGWCLSLEDHIQAGKSLLAVQEQ